MSRLELRLLGTFQAILGENIITGFESNKIRALLTYLAVESDRPHRRERLAGLLWPDWPQQSAMSNLRYALADLRKNIGDRDATPPFLLITRDSIQFNLQSDAWVDVGAFEQIDQEASQQTSLNQLQSSIDLYRGEFLEGFSVTDSPPFEQWVLVQREQLQRRVLQTLFALSEAHEQQGEHEAALLCAYRQVEMEPSHEPGQQQLMRLLALGGQRGAALTQYEAFRKTLVEELSVEPSQETKRLYEAIRDETLAPTVAWQAEHLLPRSELPPAPGEPPFKGLQYFDTPDAALFFGREALIRQLSDRLVDERFLAIVGASGSGKSSLVRAGLVPAWMRGIEISGGHLSGPVHVITPTTNPLESLASSLTRDSESITATTTLMDDLAKDSRSLQLYVRKLLSSSGDAHLLLVVDQFEEIFSMCKDQLECMAFIDNLLTAASSENAGPLRVVLTLRADFYQHCAEYDGLRLALEQHQAYIGAMNNNELRQAIEAPAHTNGWEFQPDLVNLILQDVGKEPGALPLLSHALLETWRRRQGKTLTLAGYASAGGVRKAIAQSAESLFGRLAPADQTLARSIFLRLVELGEGDQDTRRRACLDELAPAPEQQAATNAVLKILADARLLTINQDSAEVAHEALIREWPTLRGWLDEDRQGLRVHHHLTESAQEWESRGRDPGELYGGTRLGQVQEWAASHTGQLNPLEQEFLSSAVKAAQRTEVEREDQRRRELAQARSLAKTQRQRAAALAVGLGIAILLAGLSYWFYNQAQVNLRVALSRQLAAQAQSIFRTGNTQQMIAVLLAVQSVELSPYHEVSPVLQDYTLARQAARMTHNGPVTSVAFSPDGRYVVSGSRDGTARVWDAFSGKEIAHMTINSFVNSVAFSPDGHYVVLGGDDGTARVWDASIGKEIAHMTTDGPVLSVTFSPDGHYVVSGSIDYTARVWNAANGKELARMTHGGPVNSVAFSPDGRFVVSGSDDHTARVWEAATGKEIARMTYAAPVHSAAFSPDGRYIVAGSYDNTARVWDAASGVEISRMTHNNIVNAVAFSPDGRYVVSGGVDISAGYILLGSDVPSLSRDNTARVWEAATGKEIARMTHDSTVTSVAFSPDGKYVVSASDDHTTRLWEFSSGKEIARMTHDGPVNSVAFSPDGRFVVSGSDDNSARVWETSNTKRIASMTQDAPVYSVAFSPDGRYSVSGSADASARVWDAASGKEMTRMIHEGAVNSVAFSHDGRFVVSGSADGTVRVWDASNSWMGIALMIHNGAVYSVAFSPDDRYVVSGSADGTARVWEVASFKEIARMTHNGAVYAVAFSPDGRYVVSGSVDGTARVWAVASGKEIARMTHAGKVESLAFSPDGRYVVSGSYDGTARVWAVASGKEIARMTHEGEVFSVAFSPDGRNVVSGSYDGTLRVWDAVSGKEIARMSQAGAVVSATFSPDGKYVLSGSADGSAGVWQWSLQDLIAEACSRLPRNLTRAEWHHYIGDALSYRAVCPNLPLEPGPTPTPRP